MLIYSMVAISTSSSCMGSSGSLRKHTVPFFFNWITPYHAYIIHRNVYKIVLQQYCHRVIYIEERCVHRTFIIKTIVHE